jgi:hypothetical protein
MARRTQTYAIRLAVEGGGQVKAELVSVGQSGEQSLRRIESAGERASGGLKGLGRQAELLRTGIRTLGGALAGVVTVGGLAALVDRSLSAADAIGETASKIGIGVEALQELRFAASLAGVEQQTLDMALQRFVRRVAEAANGTGEAKDALAQMGIALRDQSGNLRGTEDLLGDVADAFTRIENPAERVRLAFKLFDSEGVALVNLLQEGSGALEAMRERARSLGIVLDERLVRDAGRARDELDTLAQVISANLTRAALEAAPVIADLSGWLADVAGKAGIAWERLFDTPEEKSLRTLRYELDLASSTIAKLEGRIRELQESPTLGFTTFLDTAQISALERKLDELRRARDQTQARIAFLEGPPAPPARRLQLQHPLPMTPRRCRTGPRTWSGSRASLRTSPALSLGTTVTPISSAMTKSPGLTTTPPQVIETLMESSSLRLENIVWVPRGVIARTPPAARDLARNRGTR